MHIAGYAHSSNGSDYLHVPANTTIKGDVIEVNIAAERKSIFSLAHSLSIFFTVLHSI